MKRVVAVVIGAALLAACAGGDDSASSPTGSGDVVAAEETSLTGSGDVVAAEETPLTGPGDLLPAEEVWPAFDDWAAAWGALDVDRIPEFYTDDLVIIDCAGNETHGREEWDAWIQGSFALIPDGLVEIQGGGVAVGNFVMVNMVWSGTNPISGEAFRVDMPTVVELRDGRISRLVIFCNLYEFPF